MKNSLLPTLSIHPESKMNEVYMGNLDGADYAQSNWKSKRRGLVAYDVDGKAIPSSKDMDVLPVFVLATELAEAGALGDSVYP